MGTELKTPQEWAEADGIVIYDPDGWRESFRADGITYGQKSIKDPISRTEYDARVSLSTVGPIKGDQEDFQNAAERFATTVKVPVDPVATKRSELQENLLLKISIAAQAKADLVNRSKDGPPRGMGEITGFRSAEREALNALNSLIEWEAGLL